MATGWTTADMPDLSGKTVLVTGANSGLGFETVLALAEKGAHVILACRDLDRGRQAESRVRAAHPQASTAVLALVRPPTRALFRLVMLAALLLAAQLVATGGAVAACRTFGR